MAKVQVIEDEPSQNYLLCHILRCRGFEVVSAHSGEEALPIYDSAAPDVILLDVMLQGMTGFEVCQIIREKREDHITPIIMLTADDDTEAVERAFDYGATDFLAKPINLPLVVQRVRYALRSRDNELSLKQSLDFQVRASKLAMTGYWGFDYESNQFVFNDLSRELLHLESRDYGRDEILAMIHQDDQDRALGVLSEQLDASLEIRMFLPDLGQRIISVTCSMDEEQRRFMHGAFQDVTASRSTEDLLDYLRLHDDVTGLLNEKLLIQRIEDWLDTSGARDYPPVLSLVSMLRYDRMVEVYGTVQVRVLLKHIALEFKRELITGESRVELFYTGEGRFAILGALASKEATVALIERAAAIVGKERRLEQGVYEPTAVSVAISLADTEQRADVYFQRSHIILSGLKNQPDGDVLWYDSIEDQKVHRQLQIEYSVKKALENGQFDLYLQPQIVLGSSPKVWGFEALVRWVEPDGELSAYSPADFLPAIDRLGLSVKLGYLIIAKAFEKAQQLDRAGLQCRLGINLAAQQFSDPQLVPYILEQLERSGLSAHQFEFEITEGTAMANPESTVFKLQQLREAGFHLAIDDFGVGYSSMEYLLRFPITTLKIDRIFIDEIATKKSVRAIVHSMLTLARGLNLITVAEGIETTRQCDYLDALGIDVMQGFYFQKPLVIEDAIQYALTLDRGELGAMFFNIPVDE